MNIRELLVSTGLPAGITPARGGHHTDTADEGERASAGVQYRLSGPGAFACRQPLQLHVGPQLQASPHWQDAAVRAAGSWQPQVHSEPGQTAHAHPFD
jgi:hypothetical protein